MDQSIEMMLRYPTVLLVNSETHEYSGYLPVNGVDYEISIKHSKGLLETELKITPQLKKFEEDLTKLMETSQHLTLVDLLDKMKDIIKIKAPTSSVRNYANKYRLILGEFYELRDCYISMHKGVLSEDLSQISICHMDEGGRKHDLLIKCDFEDQISTFKVADYNLPDRNSEQLFLNCNSLRDIYEKFIALIDVLQPHFDVMDILDANCWVLDPENRSLKDCYRRIGLDTNISMIVTLNPWKSREIPNIKFLGPERLVDSYREKLARNLFDWNSNEEVDGEILRLLEMNYFPPQPAGSKDVEVLYSTGECCICFSLRLNDQLPDIICANPSCEQFFHTACLYQWLTSVGAKPCFNELNGQCPNCEKVCMKTTTEK